VTLFRTPASSASESAKPAQAIAAASSANNVSPVMSGPPHDSVLRDGPTCLRRNASAEAQGCAPIGSRPASDCCQKFTRAHRPGIKVVLVWRK
jgi:hypothetical protein